MLPGPFRPELRFDAHRRRRVRRSWVRVAPVAVPLVVVCAVLLPWVRAAPAPVETAGSSAAATVVPGPSPPWAEDGGRGAGDRVVVAVSPSEPGLLPLLRAGDRVDVYGHAPAGASEGVGTEVGTDDGTGRAAAEDAPSWLVEPVLPVQRLAAGAVVVALPRSSGHAPGGPGDLAGVTGLTGPADLADGDTGAGAGVAVVPDGTVAVAVSVEEARVLTGARSGGLDLALLPPSSGAPPG